MAVKKTQLYASLWASCDKLRGGMDSSEYKDYIQSGDLLMILQMDLQSTSWLHSMISSSWT